MGKRFPFSLLPRRFTRCGTRVIGWGCHDSRKKRRMDDSVYFYNFGSWSFCLFLLFIIDIFSTAYSPIHTKSSRTLSANQKKLIRMPNGTSFACTFLEITRGGSSRVVPSDPFVRLSWILGWKKCSLRMQRTFCPVKIGMPLEASRSGEDIYWWVTLLFFSGGSPTRSLLSVRRSWDREDEYHPQPCGRTCIGCVYHHSFQEWDGWHDACWAHYQSSWWVFWQCHIYMHLMKGIL